MIKIHFFLVVEINQRTSGKETGISNPYVNTVSSKPIGLVFFKGGHQNKHNAGLSVGG